MLKATTKKAKRAAKKFFPRKPHTTRPFDSNDYAMLPSAPRTK